MGTHEAWYHSPSKNPKLPTTSESKHWYILRNNIQHNDALWAGLSRVFPDHSVRSVCGGRAGMRREGRVLGMISTQITGYFSYTRELNAKYQLNIF